MAPVSYVGNTALGWASLRECSSRESGRFTGQPLDSVASSMEIVWYTAMSMDGRIASADDSLGFLETAPGSGDDFDDFIAGVDAVLVGAATLR